MNDFTGNLKNANEPGALDEGLSDIWAAFVEDYVNKRADINLPQAKAIWKFQSENIINGISLRSLDNPKENNQPDTYKGDFWYNRYQ